MKKFDFSGKKVLVMGLGLLGGGVSVAAFFADHNAQVLVTDLRTKKELAPSIAKLKKYKITYVLGKHQSVDFLSADLIIKNPAVSSDNPFLKIAVDLKKQITMEESLFFKFCPCPIIGVTGTRGKSTTSVMIYQILKQLGTTEVFLGGNLPGSSTLKLLDKVTEKSLVVLELSSWQLADLHREKISPHIAVITNLYPDHLNRYSSMEEYIQDKKAIFLYQKNDDYLIINKKDKLLTDLIKEARSQVREFEDKDLPSDWRLKVLGVHNRFNAAAALKVAEILNVPDKISKDALEKFSGLPGRLEKIGVKNGVIYINDTTSTTPIATAMAIQALGDKNTMLLAGGNEKNLPLGDLLKAFSQDNVKKIILLAGSGTEQLLKEMKNGVMKKKIIGPYGDLKKAVKKAQEFAKAGDVILLSPGFTSFAMFRNEYDRGDQFSDIVNNL